MITQNGWKYADEWTGPAIREGGERAVAIIDPAAWEVSLHWTPGSVLLEGVAEGRQLAVRLPRSADLDTAREVIFSHLGKIRATWLGPTEESDGPVSEWDLDALEMAEAALCRSLDLAPAYVALPEPAPVELRGTAVSR